MRARRTKIQYADFSGGDANFIIGCTPESAGCLNCYARALIEGRQRKDFSEVRLYPGKLKRLRTAKFEEKGVPFRRGPGSRPIVFPVDLGDIMHPDVPSDFIYEAFDVMERREDVDWLILTKRAGRLIEFYLDAWPPNIWPGVTIENNQNLWRATILSATNAATKWFSVEPMIGPVDLDGCLGELIQLSDEQGHVGDGANWVACGGESGANRRPFDKAWACAVRDICVDYKVPFFFKQGSGRFPGSDNLLDGEVWHQLPGHYD